MKEANDPKRCEFEIYQGATEEDQEEAAEEAYQKMIFYLEDFVSKIEPEEYMMYRELFVDIMKKEDISNEMFNMANLALQALQIGAYHFRKSIENENSNTS